MDKGKKVVVGLVVAFDYDTLARLASKGETWSPVTWVSEQVEKIPGCYEVLRAERVLDLEPSIQEEDGGADAG